MKLRNTLATKQTNYVKVEYVTHLRVFWRLMLIVDLTPNFGPDNEISKFTKTEGSLLLSS